MLEFFEKVCVHILRMMVYLVASFTCACSIAQQASAPQLGTASHKQQPEHNSNKKKNNEKTSRARLEKRKVLKSKKISILRMIRYCRWCFALSRFLLRWLYFDLIQFLSGPVFGLSSLGSACLKSSELHLETISPQED